MQEENEEIRALLTSTDERSRCRGLAFMKKSAAMNGGAGVSLLMPFVIQRFIQNPIKQDRAKKGALLTRKLAYSLLPAVPVYGSSWVTVSNSVDRDVQAAINTGEKNPPLCEVGVFAMRTVLQLPFSHVEEYVKSRWEVICGIATRSKITPMRVAALDALIITCSPPNGLERHEQEHFVMKIANKPHFSEMLRKLLTDGEGQVVVKAFDLLAALQLANNANSFGSGVCLVGPMPQWMTSALGISQEMCQEILLSVSKLSLKEQQCIQHPLLAMCLSVVRRSVGAGEGKGSPLVSMLLSLSDSILHSSLNSDGNSAVVINAAISLLSIVTTHKGLLLSLFPHLTLCVDKLLGVLQKQTTLLRDWSTSVRESLPSSQIPSTGNGQAKSKPSPSINSSTMVRLKLLIEATPVTPLPATVMEVLGSLLHLMPLEQRVRHCLALAKSAASVDTFLLSLLKDSPEALAAVDFLKAMMTMLAKSLSDAVKQIAEDFSTSASVIPPSNESTNGSVKSGSHTGGSKTRRPTATPSRGLAPKSTGIEAHQLHLPDSIAPLCLWLAQNASGSMLGEHCVLELLALLASSIHHSFTDGMHKVEAASLYPSTGANQSPSGPSLAPQTNVLMHFLLVHRVVLVLFCSGSAAKSSLWVRSEGFRSIVEINTHLLLSSKPWSDLFLNVLYEPTLQVSKAALAAVGSAASMLAGKLGASSVGANRLPVPPSCTYHQMRDHYSELCKVHSALLDAFNATLKVAEGSLPNLVALSHPSTGTGSNRNKLLAWLELLSKIAYLKATSHWASVGGIEVASSLGSNRPISPAARASVQPSAMLCSATVATVASYLNITSETTGGDDACLLGTSVFRKGFARSLRILQAAYGASARSGCCDENSSGNSVTEYVHAELLPLWGHIQTQCPESSSHSPGSLPPSSQFSGAKLVVREELCALLSYATRSIEMFGYSSARGRVDEYVRSNFSPLDGGWRGVLRGSRSSFVPRTARWSDGNRSLDRRTATRVVSADGDPIKVTLSYVMFPGQSHAPVEVTAFVTNATAMTVQQVVITFNSSFGSPNMSFKKCPQHMEGGGGILFTYQAVVGYSPKRSIFSSTAPTENVPPSSSSHVSTRGQGCFVVSSLAPMATVAVTTNYIIDGLLMPIPKARSRESTGGIGNSDEVSAFIPSSTGSEGGSLMTRVSSNPVASGNHYGLQFECTVVAAAKTHYGVSVLTDNSVAGGLGEGDGMDGLFGEDDLFAAAAQYAEEAEDDAEWLTGGGDELDEGRDGGYMDPFTRPKHNMVNFQRTVGLPVHITHILSAATSDGAGSSGTSNSPVWSSLHGSQEVSLSIFNSLFPRSAILAEALPESVSQTRPTLVENTIASTPSLLFAEQEFVMDRAMLFSGDSKTPLKVSSTGAIHCGTFVPEKKAYISLVTLEWLNLRGPGNYTNALGTHRFGTVGGAASAGAAFFGCQISEENSSTVTVSCRVSQAGRGGWREGEEDVPPKWLLDLLVSHYGFMELLEDVVSHLLLS